MIGIDPGASGGAVCLDNHGNIIWTQSFTDMTDHDIAELFREFDDHQAIIESVHSMPGQGVASSFKFGRHFGFLIGLLTGLRMQYRLVTPQKWQKEMGCLTHGDKNISKAAAQRRWPQQKWTHAIADAALIGEYGRITTT